MTAPCPYLAISLTPFPPIVANFLSVLPKFAGEIYIILASQMCR
ncbi:hypothetical protein SAMN05421772_103102 [Paracoccus saliphilus]|uniref:Uncharacterized protein n=1 Tax=Paracoccus saliphilus TaxID=405559 RepID=A0AA46A4U9_9RHOB|nr:hypothetical protein SAMN05421772_103102 [Paracoccus saliphilus]